jgi:hypothetical protein
MSRLDDRLVALKTMSPGQLRQEWLRAYKTPPPSHSPSLLLLGAAYRIQEKEFGGLSTANARTLAKLGARYAKTGEIGADATATLKVGSRLVRDWHGESHHVLICEAGYQYRNQNYRSLTEIAQLITGAKWSGPRFFGLKPRTKAGRGEKR